MKVGRLGAVLGALAMVFATMLALPSSASAYGSSTGCTADEWHYQTNDWSYFYNHKIRGTAAACLRIGHSNAKDYVWLKYVRTPTITFPSRGRISSETITMTKSPYVSSVSYNDADKPWKVRYSFSAKSCSLYAICQNWDFYFYYTFQGTQICSVGGACDEFKHWA